MTTKSEMLEGIDGIIKSKVIANNTVSYLLKSGESRIRLHYTDIIRQLPNGHMILDSGGWKTVTTKSRLNDYARPLIFIQDNSVWYIHRSNYGAAIPFFDGIEFDESMYPINLDRSPIDPGAVQFLKKRIKKYVDGFIKALDAGEIGLPSAGDCWYCSMKIKNGTSLGESFGDTTHLSSHMDECYYVPSLMVNAVNKYENELSNYAKYILHSKMNGKSIEMIEGIQDIAYQQIRKCLAKYMKGQFGLPV